MPDIKITDKLDKPVTTVTVDLAHPSSLIKYLKAQALRLAVFPDFLERKDEILTQAATKPIQFRAEAGHAFQLGNTIPEIQIAPGASAAIIVNATADSNLFSDDPFHLPAKVPTQTGYVGLTFGGSLSLGVSGAPGGTAGDLTFGFNNSSGIDIGYYQAFPLGKGEPTLVEALSETLAAFVIPADLSDLASLGDGDIATVAGNGTLTVSGAVSVTLAPNPLASVDLPLGAGTLSLQEGATAGISTSLSITGSYQVRAHNKGNRTIELSYFQQRGTTLQADLSANAGVSATLGEINLITALLGAISKDPTKENALLADLQPEERSTLTDAIKQGLNHSLQASIDAVLTTLTENDAAFQYEIQLDRLTSETSTAIHRALDGDLRGLTILEESAQPDGTIAPGIKMINSVLTATRKRGLTLHLNLLGILNYTSVAEFVKNSEIVTDSTTGNITIKETVSGQRISAIVKPLDRDEALRKALFDSVLITTTYRAGRAIAPPTLASEHVHFALNQNTNHPLMGDYLNWFVTLNLLTKADRKGVLDTFIDGGPSSCILRTAFNDHDSTALFLDDNGKPRPNTYYLEVGRTALRALLDTDRESVNQLRYRLLGDPIWQKALEVGANVNLAPLVGLSVTDPRVSLLIGDVFVISEWADAMSTVGALVLDMRTYVGTREPEALANDNAFKQKRTALQKKLSRVAHASKMRFDEPWGLVALFWAAGSPTTAYAKAATAHLTVERRAQPAIATA